MMTDPTSTYCKQVSNMVDKHIKLCVDAYYNFFLSMGLCKADAIWSDIEMCQEQMNCVDLSVNFNGPMA